ncbi:MAG TPA: hypothetical protein ACHBX0_14720 [Arsenophonus sp.]
MLMLLPVILSLMDEFNNDPHKNKINLSIGLYYDDKGNKLQLQTVGKAKSTLNQLPAMASCRPSSIMVS